jgi:acetylornithine/succinyldiaminopimelate/putrescine aminotransferase/acyl-CoA synthetase (AMP-forming)/AMP-acid ligase II/predicted amino acid dehydrogenase
MSPRFATLVDMLEHRAAEGGDRAFLFLEDGERPGPRLTFSRLAVQARAIAAELQARGLAGSRILLMYPPGLEFVAGFFGCLYAGAVAVPVYPPDPARLDRSLTRVREIARDADARLLLTTRTVLALAGQLPGASLGLAMLASDGVDEGAAAHWRRPALAGDTLAFLQYTSGSTSAPKGVRVGHDHLLYNQRQVELAMRRSPGCVNVSWLPLFHDMGLIGNVLGPLYTGADCVLMSPLDFLTRPVRWLRAVSTYQAHTSGGPNFAYDLCTRKVTDDERAGLDLGRWTIAFNGAEPVRADTLERFADRFAVCGFRREAFFPCYGLAEATLFVTGPSTVGPARVLAVRGSALADGVAVASEDSNDARRLVSCGHSWCEQILIIVAPATGERCADGEVGEIWVHGENVAGGYHGQPEASAATFGARLEGRSYLRTGDLGFVQGGELYVTGRMKDVLVIRGRNHYPQDIEATVERCEPRIRRGCVAAFAWTVEGEERVAVVAEVDARAAPVDGDTLADLRGAVAREHGLRVAAVVLVRAGTIPKTSSGKIQRHRCRDEFCSNSLEVIVGDAASSRGAEVELSPRQAALLKQVVVTTRRVLGAPELEIGADEPLARLGLDSLVIVEWKLELERMLAVRVPVLTEATTLVDLVRALDAAPRTAVEPCEEDPWAELVNPPVARRLRAFHLDRRYVRGEGCWLWDDEGRRCLDFTAAYGALPFGFNPPEIWAALQDVALEGAPSLVQPSRLAAAGRLARRLVDVAPPGLCRVTFANSGAEAIEAAIKLVRAATGRLGVVVAERGFHGKTLGALSATARVSLQQPFGAPAPGFLRVAYGDLDALAAVLTERAGELAAVLLEPIQGEGGIFESPPGYLRGVRELCDRHGVLLALDEVQTGLGRTGRLFACEHEGVVPDVLALAKALGGGLVPAAAVLSRAACFSETFALRHTSTFAGNALAAYAGLRTLELLTREDQALVRGVAELGGVLLAGLQALRREHPALITDVRGRGFMLGLELTADPAAFGRQGLLASMAAQETLGVLLCSYLLCVEGIRLAPTLIGSRVVRVEPPLIATRAMIDEFLAALARTFALVEACDSAALLGHLAGRVGGKSRPRAVPRRCVARPRGGDGRWGFVFHPLGARSYIDFDAGLAGLAGDELDALVANLHAAPPIDGSAALLVGAGRVESPVSAAFGEVAAVPATAEELLAMPAAEALARVREAVVLVRDRGARIVGLGAYTSIVTGGGLHVADTGVAITTGNSFTVLAATELVLQATRALAVPLADRTVAIVGATGSIGRAVAIELAPHVGGLLLIGNPAHPQAAQARLLRVRMDVVLHLATMRGRGGGLAEAAARIGDGPAALARLQELGVLVGSTSPGADLRKAAVVVAATSNPHALISAEHLGPGAIVCDVSQPANVSSAVAAARPDVCILDGGVVTLPGGRDLGIGFGLAPGLAYACIAETILLALDRREHDASTGVDLQHAFIDELRALAQRHDFRVTPTRAGRPLVLPTR